MKASELRIGNYVGDMDGMTLQVTSIGELCNVKYSPGLYHIDELNSLPLIEEWLLKFGFRKHSMHGYDRHFEYHHMKLNSPITALYNSDFAMSLDNCARGVQYVHQLQNLYFALTGEELTINP